MEQADSALYASKHAGKNQTTLAGAGASPAAPPAGDRIDLRLLHEQDADSAVHSAHVANLAVAIARSLGLPVERLPAPRAAAKLHDIGKIAVPRAILRSPARRPRTSSPSSRPIPRSGPMAAHRRPEEIARFVAEHHENVDGTGYPAGLCGDEIALESRIIRVADSYLAMTLDRPYCAAISAPTPPRSCAAAPAPTSIPTWSTRCCAPTRSPSRASRPPCSAPAPNEPSPGPPVTRAR